MSVSVSALATVHATGHVGISPCSVFYDGHGSSSSLYATQTNQFRKNYFEWDFGDPSAPTYAYGSEVGRSSNEAEGMHCNHVYEITEGGGDQTFTATLYMADGVDVSSASAPTVTIYDPIGANGWTTTHVFSNNSDFTGAPAGATQHSSVTNFDTVRGFLAAGVRCLLHRGHSFTTGGGPNNVNGPWMIGAFGSGAKPHINATGNNVHIVWFGDAGGPFTDIRFVDLYCDGNGFSNCQGITYENQTANSHETYFYDGLTILRCDVVNCHRGFEFFQQWYVCMAHCTASTDGYTYFSGGCWYSSALGNYLLQTDRVDNGEGNSRWGDYQKFVFSANTVEGSQQDRQSIKSGAGTLGAIEANYVIISGCHVLGTAADSQVDQGPQNAGVDERPFDYIIERNWVESNSSVSGPKFPIHARASRGTIRNNFINMSLANPANVAWCIGIERRGAEPIETDVEAFNNTAYSSLAGGGGVGSGVGFFIVAVDNGNAGLSNIVVRNNYGSGPNWTERGALWDPHSRATASNNTLTNTPGWVTSNGVGTGTLTQPSDFVPLTTSAAKDAGVAVTMFRDFFGITPLGTYDLGFAQFPENGQTGAGVIVGTGVFTAVGAAKGSGAAFAAGTG